MKTFWKRLALVALAACSLLADQRASAVVWEVISIVEFRPGIKSALLVERRDLTEIRGAEQFDTLQKAVKYSQEEGAVRFGMLVQSDNNDGEPQYQWRECAAFLAQ